MTVSHMVVVDLESGEVVEGRLAPSSNLLTHLALYQAFPQIGGVVHTHSRFATAFAQAGRGILPLGTTHADYFYGEIPCTRELTPAEISGAYEIEMGAVIVERFTDLDPKSIPGALVHGHGPFTWGRDATGAVQNAAALEEIACMATLTLSLAPDTPPIGDALLARHYLRKHGPRSYYGQT